MAAWKRRWGRFAAGWRAGMEWLGARWQAGFVLANALRPLFWIGGLLLVMAALVAVLPQGQDLVASSLALPVGARHVAFTLSLVFLGFAGWAAARLTVALAFGPRAEWRGSCWRLWLPRALGAGALLPFAVAAVAGRDGSPVVGLLIVLLALGLLALLALRTRVPGLRGVGRRREGQSEEDYARLARRWAVLIAGVGIVLLALLTAFNVALPRAMGAPALAASAVGFLTASIMALHMLTRYPLEIAAGERARRGYWRFLPVIPAALLLALLFQQLGWTDNHRVRADFPLAADPKPSVEDAYLRWYRAQGRTAGELPMLVVATAGGASRAGYWTGEVMGRLDVASGGAFGRRLFAVSSVSGGSLGAAAWLGRASLGERPVRPEAVRATTGADHLSPAVASLLYGDLIKRFLPGVPIPDRAAALEDSFARAWDDGCADARCRGLFARRFLALDVGAGAGRFQPLWLVNGTRVEDGRRIITAPVAVTDADFPDAIDLHRLLGRDVGVATAITNGARFPLVSPTGTLRDAGGVPRGGIIDGGYFENSGITTAVDVIRAARRAHARLQAAGRIPAGVTLLPVLIEIDNDDDPGLPARADPAAPLPAREERKVLALEGRPRGLSPLLGLYNARSGRGTQAAVTAARELRPPAGRVFRFQLCDFNGRRTSFNWVLSKANRDLIDRAFDGGSRCSAGWAAQRETLAELLRATPSGPAAARR